MRVAIQTFGTRGDAQPYLALARGLIARGHDVQLAAPEQFSDLAERCSVPFAPLPGTLLDLLASDEGKAAVAAGRGFSAGLALLGKIRPAMTRLMDAEWEALRGFRPDLILHHPKSLVSPAIAARLGARSLLASPLPGFTPTSAFPQSHRSGQASKPAEQAQSCADARCSGSAVRAPAGAMAAGKARPAGPSGGYFDRRTLCL